MRALALSALTLLPALSINSYFQPMDCSGDSTDERFFCAGADMDSVNISGNWQEEVPGDSPEPDYGGSFDGGDSNYGDPDYGDATTPSDTADSADASSGNPLGSNLSVGLATGTASDTPAFPTTVTVTDLTRAQPNSARIHMEPDGWALLNSPTNFWVETGAPRVQTTLFNTPVTVEFIPSRVHWDYGDGTTTTTETLGASWSNLNQQPHTATQTSHTYTTGGTYTVHATIHYRAIVHVNGTSINVSGTIQQTATTAPIATYRFSTVLTPNP